MTDAVTVSPATCERVIGWSWRSTVAYAQRNGITILGEGRRRLIPVAPLLAALAAAKPAPEPRLDDLDDDSALRVMRERLGLRVVGGGG